MDNEFVEKLKAISVYKKISEDEDQFDFSATFNREKDGLIKITTDKGELIYQFKPIGELYAEQESQMNTEEEMLSLLYQPSRNMT